MAKVYVPQHVPYRAFWASAVQSSWNEDWKIWEKMAKRDQIQLWTTNLSIKRFLCVWSLILPSQMGVLFRTLDNCCHLVICRFNVFSESSNSQHRQTLQIWRSWKILENTEFYFFRDSSISPDWKPEEDLKKHYWSHKPLLKCLQFSKILYNHSGKTVISICLFTKVGLPVYISP